MSLWSHLEAVWTRDGKETAVVGALGGEPRRHLYILGVLFGVSLKLVQRA